VAEVGPGDRQPTPVFFYVLEPGDEFSVEIAAGKTLVIRCLAVGEADDEGIARVFFELKGGPRRIRVRCRPAAATAVSHPEADPGNANHVAAPMPGMVATVAVEQGQKVVTGDLLLTIEAMKMETAIRAERDGEIKTVTAGAGTQVDAKDLLVEFA